MHRHEKHKIEEGKRKLAGLDSSSADACVKHKLLTQSISIPHWLLLCQASPKTMSFGIPAPGFYFPIQYHDPDTFSPQKIKTWHALWESLSVDNRNAKQSGWWDYYREGTLQLRGASLANWHNSPQVREQLKKNVSMWLVKQSLLTARDWMRMLQCCFEFDLMKEFRLIWDRYQKQQPSSAVCNAVVMQIF